MTPTVSELPIAAIAVAARCAPAPTLQSVVFAARFASRGGSLRLTYARTQRALAADGRAPPAVLVAVWQSLEVVRLCYLPLDGLFVIE